MPLVPMMPEIQEVQREGRALPLFDVVDTISVAGVFQAFEDCGRGGIVGIYSGMLETPGGKALVSYVRAYAEQCSLPISLMLDHGRSVDDCLLALSLGFTDVMYDGARLPIEENIANTCRVVDAARQSGAGVEAELGIVGSGSKYDSFGALGEGFTDPEDAARLVAETDCDLLAIAVGTAHGEYNAEPRLDLDLLHRTRDLVAAPLALHGGSGLSDEQFLEAIAGGIAKINIFTDLSIVAADSMAEVVRSGSASFHGITAAGTEAFRVRSRHYHSLFTGAPSSA